MSLKDLIKDYDFTINDCLLKETTKDLADFKLEEVKDCLTDMYKHPSPLTRRMASVFNSIFTHHAQTFLLTKKSLIDLLNQDDLQDKKNISGQDYKLFIFKLTNNGHFDVLRRPTGNKSGVYKLVQKDFVKQLHNLHSADWFDNQEQKVVDYYDEVGKKDDNKPSMRELALQKGLL